MTPYACQAFWRVERGMTFQKAKPDLNGCWTGLGAGRLHLSNGTTVRG
jgi:hypothetical protein